MGGTLAQKSGSWIWENWRAIVLLSIPSKVSCRIILKRLKHALDYKLRCEQAGFRKHKSCNDHIASLRIMNEQCRKRHTPLNMNFIEKAFDSVNRNVIWQLMGHYGITPNLIRLIHELYEASSCQVIHNGKFHLRWKREFVKAACCHQWSLKWPWTGLWVR